MIWLIIGYKKTKKMRPYAMHKIHVMTKIVIFKLSLCNLELNFQSVIQLNK